MARGTIRIGLSAFTLLACFAVGACVSQIDELSPSIETLQLLRQGGTPLIAIGDFAPASKDVGRKVAVRLSTMHAPKGKNFADFLAATFRAELGAAGKLDPGSALRLDGVLLESRLDEDIAKGRASLSARVILSRSTKAIFSKTYRVESYWKSDFIGATAIPEAFRQYNSLYALLVRKVLMDPAFSAAARRTAS